MIPFLLHGTEVAQEVAQDSDVLRNTLICPNALLDLLLEESEIGAKIVLNTLPR
jgi:hypothetical protein